MVAVHGAMQSYQDDITGKALMSLANAGVLSADRGVRNEHGRAACERPLPRHRGRVTPMRDERRVLDGRQGSEALGDSSIEEACVWPKSLRGRRRCRVDGG